MIKTFLPPLEIEGLITTELKFLKKNLIFFKDLVYFEASCQLPTFILFFCNTFKVEILSEKIFIYLASAQAILRLFVSNSFLFEDKISASSSDPGNIKFIFLFFTIYFNCLKYLNLFLLTL